jgi:putative salt-induced outer membrane protein
VPDWTGSLGAGLSVTTGNSDTLGVNVAFGVKYAPKGPSTFKAEALYILQRSDGVRTVDKINALGRYEYALSERAFAFGEVGFQRDVFKNVDYLIAPLVGAGYKVVAGPKVTFAVDASVGGAFEKSPEFGATSSAAYALGESFVWKLSPGASVYERAAALFKTSDSSDYNLHFEAGISAAVTKSSELKATYLVDFKNMPTGGASKTDSTLVVTIVMKM